VPNRAPADAGDVAESLIAANETLAEERDKLRAALERIHRLPLPAQVEDICSEALR
jgi:hypothetical protein